MALRRPAGVLFDAGGTLVGVNTARLRAALRARGHETQRLPEAFWRTAALLDTEFAPASGTYDDWWRRWQARLAEHAGVPVPILHAAYEECDAEWLLWDEPLPGAVECLERLRAAGVRLGVVSNADGRMAEALERAGLACFFEVIVDSGVVGVAKPDPAIFTHALEPLGLAPAETWYLGDLVTYDAAAADAAGLLSWVIDHAGLHSLPHPRRVRALGEFADRVLEAVDGAEQGQR